MLLGLVARRANQRDVLVAFASAVFVMTWVVSTCKLAFAWHVPLGGVFLAVGGLLSLTHPAPRLDLPTFAA